MKRQTWTLFAVAGLMAAAAGTAAQTPEHDRARAQAQARTQPQGPEGSRNRGEQLYAAHCAACHRAQTQWRSRRVSTDVERLRTQVQRWQGSAGQNWTRAEVEEVTSYMNRHFYRFRTGFEKG